MARNDHPQGPSTTSKANSHPAQLDQNAIPKGSEGSKIIDLIRDQPLPVDDPLRLRIDGLVPGHVVGRDVAALAADQALRVPPVALAIAEDLQRLAPFEVQVVFGPRICRKGNSISSPSDRMDRISCPSTTDRSVPF